jgi:hypothetical protein
VSGMVGAAGAAGAVSFSVGVAAGEVWDGAGVLWAPVGGGWVHADLKVKHTNAITTTATAVALRPKVIDLSSLSGMLPEPGDAWPSVARLARAPGPQPRGGFAVACQKRHPGISGWQSPGTWAYNATVREQRCLRLPTMPSPK